MQLGFPHPDAQGPLWHTEGVSASGPARPRRECREQPGPADAVREKPVILKWTSSDRVRPLAERGGSVACPFMRGF